MFIFQKLFIFLQLHLLCLGQFYHNNNNWSNFKRDSFSNSNSFDFPSYDFKDLMNIGNRFEPKLDINFDLIKPKEEFHFKFQDVEKERYSTFQKPLFNNNIYGQNFQRVMSGSSDYLSNQQYTHPNINLSSNIDKFSGSKSTGNCGRSVRNIIENTYNVNLVINNSAKNYGNTLVNEGGYSVIKEVKSCLEKEVSNFSFKNGDVIIFDGNNSDSPHGHIQIYNDNTWNSDFKQKGILPGSKYQTSPIKIYRRE